MLKTCRYCKIENEYKNHQQFAQHVSICNLNPINLNKKEKLQNILKIRYDKKLGQLKNFQVSCHKCSKTFEVSEREKQFPTKEKYFCCRSCANTRIHSEETKQLQRTASTGKENINKGKGIKYFCLQCNKKIDYKTKTELCKKCYLLPENKHLRSSFLIGKTGGIRDASGKNRKFGCYYNDQWFDSGWEIEFVKRLDFLNIKWIKNTKIFFNYVDENLKQRKYYPDFYLEDFDLWIEIKGWIGSQNIHKMKSCLNQINNFIILDHLDKINYFDLKDIFLLKTYTNNLLLMKNKQQSP